MAGSRMLDFSRLVARYGQVVSAKQLEGVHLGTKVGRSPGVRLGYSQIANPVYLMRKRTAERPPRVGPDRPQPDCQSRQSTAA